MRVIRDREFWEILLWAIFGLLGGGLYFVHAEGWSPLQALSLTWAAFSRGQVGSATVAEPASVFLAAWMSLTGLFVILALGVKLVEWVFQGHDPRERLSPRLLSRRRRVKQELEAIDDPKPKRRSLFLRRR